MSRVTLAEPVEIAKFWKNRRRNESVHVSLSEYEGHCLINVRVYCTGTDGIDRPTPKGLSLVVLRLPNLAKAINKALTTAQSLGLIDNDGAAE
jgi:hypothetical protein